MHRVKFTKRAVEGFDLERDGQWVTDTEVPQLVVRLTPTASTYVARWTSRVTGKRIQTVIAPCGSISVDAARDKARTLMAADAAPTVTTLGDVYKIWDEHHASKVSAAHVEGFRSGWKKHIAPTFEKTKLTRLTHAEIEKWYNRKLKECPTNAKGEVRGVPYSAAAVNRQVAYLSKLCSIGQKGGFLLGNPCEKLEKSTPHRRVTIFVREDVKALAENLDAVASKYPIGVALIRFLMVYPCRGIEARGMMWSDLDLAIGAWNIPADRYKTGLAKVFPLAPLQIGLLQSLPRWSATYVFPAVKDRNAPVRREHQRDVWAKVRPKPLGAHTLRKTIGTDMLNGGMPLEIISKLLGHSSTLVTQQVYAHLSPSTSKRFLELWGSLTEDDENENKPEPTEFQEGREMVLKAQAAMSVKKEFDPR